MTTYFSGDTGADTIAINTVGTTKIVDGAVTTVKIADSNVTTAKIADASVTVAKLASGAARSNFGAGAVLQVVSTTKTDAFSSTVEDAWTDITGMSVNITPSAASNKVMVMVMASIGAPNNYIRGLRLVRNSTAIAIGNDSTGFEGTTSQATANDAVLDTLPIIHLDSPSTTSSTTYKLQYYLESAAVVPFYLNRPHAPSANTWNVVSSITVMEIAA